MRDLGSVGVVTDVDPYDLPTPAFSFAKNVRFEDGKIQRGPVFRKVADTANLPKHLLSFQTQNNEPQTFFVDDLGYVFEYSTLTGETDRSPTFTPASGDHQLSSCILNNVVYVNRSDRVMWYRDRDDVGTDFSILTNDVTGTVNWPSNGRARILRSMSGVLITANIQKGSSVYPNMVKWSNFSTAPGSPPADWDYTSPSSNAGENTLAEMDGAIIEALPTRDTMFLYSAKETWAMEFIGGLDMFRFARRFDKGIISDNCVVDEAGIQYVFGQNDLWMHDGTSVKSLASGKVRRFVFDTLRRDNASEFFVVSNPRLNEIIFCYVADDKYIKFPAIDGQGCNRAVIYNYTSDTFTFADLPYVTCATSAYLAKGDSKTFASVTGTFDIAGGSFTQLESLIRTNLTFGCNDGVGGSYSLRTFEAYREVETGFLLDPDANGAGLAERTGYDLDEIGAELRGYKLVSSVYPQGRLDGPDQVLTFTFGLNDHPAHTVEWMEPQTFTLEYYKLDYNVAGRFLSMKFEQNDLKPFTLSALDIDVSILGSY
jgi:hypothetical protein